MKAKLFLLLILALVNTGNAQLTDVCVSIGSPYDVLINGNDLFITEFSDGEISKADVSSALPTTTTNFATGLGGAMGIDMIGADVYIADLDSNKVSKHTGFVLNNEEQFVELFEISPNPTNDFIAIENKSDIELRAVVIVDVMGRVVQKIDLNGMKTIKNISLRDYPNGVYFVKINSDKGSIVKRLIKQ